MLCVSLTSPLRDVFFVGAQLLVITALLLAMRSLISFRLATLDAVIVTAAGVALAAPFVRHGLENGVDVSSVFTLNRPILSIVILMLVTSAALRSWEGVPLSMAMLGLAESALTVGNLIYAFEAVIIGGLGSLWGTLAGGMVVGIAQTVGARINPEWQILAGHLAFLAVLIVRPRGFLPRAID